MANDIDQIAQKAFQVLRANTPKDTGNLRENSTQLIKTAFGYTMTYVVDIADYIVYLNENTESKHYHFLDDKVAPAVSASINSSANSYDNNATISSYMGANNAAANKRMLQSLDRTIDQTDAQVARRFNVSPLTFRGGRT